MKLFYALPSPFVRKVMVFAHETGLVDRLELEPVNPFESRPDHIAKNPLSKVPTLITEDGLTLFDSPLICDYLDSLHDGPRLIPQSGAERWRALRLHEIADGILVAALAIVLETRRDPGEQSPAFMARQHANIDRALDMLEGEEADTLAGPLTLGVITAGVALGYLDFRLGDKDWRAGHPKLAAWYEAFSQRPSMQATRPQDLA